MDKIFVLFLNSFLEFDIWLNKIGAILWAVLSLCLLPLAAYTKFGMMKRNKSKSAATDDSAHPLLSDDAQSINSKFPKEDLQRSVSTCTDKLSRTFPITCNGIGKAAAGKFPRNSICNQKYSIFTFPFLFLRDQLHYFFNVFFLLVGISQLLPAFRVDNSFTYFVPLAVVLSVTMLKEAYADFKRFRRDQEANAQTYLRLEGTCFKPIPSSGIQVGDVICLEKGQRVPADLVLLRATHDSSGAVFIKTDQLDGETDWKLRVALPPFNRLPSDVQVGSLEAELCAEAPHKDIYTFIGTVRYKGSLGTWETLALNVEHTLWMNTVLAAGSVVGVVVYTGKDTRAIMNTAPPASKSSRIERELSVVTFVLFVFAAVFALALALCRASSPLWMLYAVRFVILFSYVIPVSLRINVDMARTLFNRWIEGDACIGGTTVRSVNICEEMGRIAYLLSDKTGTLTKNDMEMRRIHMGTVSFDADTLDEFRSNLKLAATSSSTALNLGTMRGRRDLHFRIFDFTQALALCHNVTPVQENGELFYQASSPDEVAIVKWSEAVGLALVHRDRERIRLQATAACGEEGRLFEFEILHLFPFTSEGKRMGIVVKDLQSGEIVFYQKGADSVMTAIVQKSDWLEEECGNMAREGLRTLVIARKKLSEPEYAQFAAEFHQAKIALLNRTEQMHSVVERLLEREMELLGLTGVEDKLQDDVKVTLEFLREAGIRIWMLTGDKVETATCIALSSRLVARGQPIYTVQRTTAPESIAEALRNLARRPDHCLVIDGQSLQHILDAAPREFIEHTSKMSAVVCCRCSPTQKALVTSLLKKHTGQIVCSIGDGGNDVSMIQAANVGIGIVGKEGKQASLASDVSITQFSHITRLFLWHGRSCYRSTAKVAQFVIHRGVILTVMQGVFCGIFYVAPIALYRGLLTIGYSTVFTMFPVFSLVLDHDVPAVVALRYPELYKELVKGRCLSPKTFFAWMCKSVYQGGVIMLLTLHFFEYELLHMAAITYSALIMNELLMIGLEVHTWHPLMFVAELGSFGCFLVCMLFFKEAFNIDYKDKVSFLWNMSIIGGVSFLPFIFFKVVHRLLLPPSYSKLK